MEIIEFIGDNMPSVIAAGALIIITAAVVFIMIKRRRQGKSSCGCDCAHCAGNCENRE